MQNKDERTVSVSSPSPIMIEFDSSFIRDSSASERSKALIRVFRDFPNERFCLWEYRNINGRRTKMPINPISEECARSNDAGTFTDLRTAQMHRNDHQGIGLGLFGSVAAIDIDHCIDDQDGISPIAAQIIETMDSYTEVSPSGHGIRILFCAPGFKYDVNRYYINRHDIGVEIYVPGATKKFVTITGKCLRNYDSIAPDRAYELKSVLLTFMQRPLQVSNFPSRSAPTDVPKDDRELLRRALNAKNGQKFQSLWSGDISGYRSRSEADLALCYMLAYWTGNDADRINRLFKQSGLMREKWNRRQSGSTYGDLTVRKVLK